MQLKPENQTGIKLCLFHPTKYPKSQHRVVVIIIISSSSISIVSIISVIIIVIIIMYTFSALSTMPKAHHMDYLRTRNTINLKRK